MIPESSNESEVCLFYDDKNMTSLLRADHVRSKLQAIVVLIWGYVLCFKKDDIWLHSIWSGEAMAMFLSGTSVIIIMRVRRCFGEALLEYIWEHIESFTFSKSQRILKFEEFFNLSRENSENSTDEVINIDDVDFVNKVGPDSVLFCIKFNGLAFHNGNENEDISFKVWFGDYNI